VAAHMIDLRSIRSKKFYLLLMPEISLLTFIFTMKIFSEEITYYAFETITIMEFLFLMSQWLYSLRALDTWQLK
jgi:hypothetical protein